MANFFGMLKPNQLIWFDGIVLAAAGLALLLPTLVAPVIGFALGPISVGMVVGALAVARAIDLMFMRR